MKDQVILYDHSLGNRCHDDTRSMHIQREPQGHRGVKGLVCIHLKKLKRPYQHNVTDFLRSDRVFCAPLQESLTHESRHASATPFFPKSSASS